MMSHRCSEMAESEEELFSLLPDTWRDAASSFLKIERLGAPLSHPAHRVKPGNTHRGYSFSEPREVQMRSNSPFKPSFDFENLTDNEDRSLPGPLDGEPFRNVHLHLVQKRSLLQGEKPWRLSPKGGERDLASARSESVHGSAYGELPRAGLKEKERLTRRSNTEQFQWDRIIKPTSIHIPRPDFRSVLVTGSKCSLPTSSSVTGARQSLTPSLSTQLVKATTPVWGAAIITDSAEMKLQKLEISSSEAGLEKGESRGDAVQEYSPAEPVLPNSRGFYLSHNGTRLGLTLGAAEDVDEHTEAKGAWDCARGIEEDGLATPWTTAFRIISGNNRKKTKRRTLVAPRCHDAYGQLATAIRRQAAARNARHHLLCGAAEGLLCVRMPCITRNCFSSEEGRNVASGFFCGSRECACPFTSEPIEEEVGNTNNSPVCSRIRRRQGLHRPSSQDLLLRFLQLFKELRWGEAIRGRVRQQLTQLQGCLLALQRLQAASIEQHENARGLVAVEDFLRVNKQWAEYQEEAAATSRGAASAVTATPKADPKAVPFLNQDEVEKFIASMRQGGEEKEVESCLPIASLVAILRERRGHIVDELRKAQRIVNSAQEQIELCRQRHRERFVEHASQLLNVRSSLNISLRFEDICVISRSQNELFAFAYFLCMSQEGQTVTWPVVEAMAESKVFFLSWQAVRVALVAFHLLKSITEPFEPMALGQQKANSSLHGRLLSRTSDGLPPGDSWVPEATAAVNSEKATVNIHVPGNGRAYILEKISPLFSYCEAQQVLAEELPLAEARDSVAPLGTLPPRLESLLIASVERASSMCASHDSDREEQNARSAGCVEKECPNADEAAHIDSVIGAAEEARMHNWTLAGCDTLLKLLVATAVQIAKRTELFSADTHASFL